MKGLRFHKSVKLPLGFRLNFSKSGIGWSAGFRGFRFGRDARGRTYRNVGLPGTGLSYREYDRQPMLPQNPSSMPSQQQGLGTSSESQRQLEAISDEFRGHGALSPDLQEQTTGARRGCKDCPSSQEQSRPSETLSEDLSGKTSSFDVSLVDQKVSEPLSAKYARMIEEHTAFLRKLQTQLAEVEAERLTTEQKSDNASPERQFRESPEMLRGMIISAQVFLKSLEYEYEAHRERETAGSSEPLSTNYSRGIETDTAILFEYENALLEYHVCLDKAALRNDSEIANFYRDLINECEERIEEYESRRLSQATDYYDADEWLTDLDSELDTDVCHIENCRTLLVKCEGILAHLQARISDSKQTSDTRRAEFYASLKEKYEALITSVRDRIKFFAQKYESDKLQAEADRLEKEADRLEAIRESRGRLEPESANDAHEIAIIKLRLAAYRSLLQKAELVGDSKNIAFYRKLITDYEGDLNFWTNAFERDRTEEAGARSAGCIGICIRVIGYLALLGLAISPVTLAPSPLSFAIVLVVLGACLILHVRKVPHRKFWTGLLVCSSYAIAVVNSAARKPTAPADESQTVLPPVPQYRVYRTKTNRPVPIVVSAGTSEGELKALLWFLREKVRLGRFDEIGIKQPTSISAGKRGFRVGTIAVYMGEASASEVLTRSGSGPCGPGDHSAAVYRWGLSAEDNLTDADKDSGIIYSGDRVAAEVFSYRDKWQPKNLEPSNEAGPGTKPQ